MSYAAYRTQAAAHAAVQDRISFLKATYLHLAGAIFAYILLTGAVVQSSAGGQLAMMLSNNWLLSLGIFMGGGWIAQRWAFNAGSAAMQYLGLALYTVVMAIMSIPLLYVAAHYSDPSVIPTAGLLTATVFGGLTLTVFTTKKDFSFLGQALNLAGFAALGLIVCSLIFGFTLGTIFAAAMVVLFAGYTLYYTSTVLHQFPVGAHVPAALMLFSAVAMMFLYILQLVMSFSRD